MGPALGRPAAAAGLAFFDGCSVLRGQWLSLSFPIACGSARSLGFIFSIQSHLFNINVLRASQLFWLNGQLSTNRSIIRPSSVSC